MAEVVLAGLALNAALTLAKPKARVAKAYYVGVLGVDDLKTFTVTQIAEPKAVFSRLFIHCKQLDGAWAMYDILKGESAKAVAGAGNLKFEYMDIVAYSLVTGTLFIRVKDDAGKQIGYWETTGGEVRNLEVTFDMPPRNYGLTVEIGHL